MSTFLITGHGRSGTMFLARLMDQSPTWTVQHEPHPRVLVTRPGQVQKRFDTARGNYGEVNSLLRKVAMDLVVDELGVVLRNPRDITLSFYNKSIRDRRPYAHRLRAFVDGFKQVAALPDAGVPVIWFEDMIHSAAYRSAVLSYFGVRDVPGEKIVDAGPVNQLKSHERVAKTFDELPELILDNYAKHVQWFEDRFYAETRPANINCVVQEP